MYKYMYKYTYGTGIGKGTGSVEIPPLLVLTTHVGISMDVGISKVPVWYFVFAVSDRLGPNLILQTHLESRTLSWGGSGFL